MSLKLKFEGPSALGHDGIQGIDSHPCPKTAVFRLGQDSEEDIIPRRKENTLSEFHDA